MTAESTFHTRRDAIVAASAAALVSALPATAAETIRPFKVNVPDEELADLRRRILATRWPEREPVADSSQGVQLATMQKLAHYWATDYDWRKVEARLNALPQFITEIDGLDIHFIHVRSKHENALPVIVTHGWPGSIIEQLKIVDPLTNPTAHGGTAADAFHVVIPSMPGYGFSGKPTTTGWDPTRIARAWAVLMKPPRLHEVRGAGRRLGRARHRADGRAGAAGTARHPHQHAVRRTGRNLRRRSSPASAPPGLSADESRAFDRLAFFFTHGLSYAQQMANRPQTLYGIADSPIGLAAWFLDHDLLSYELIARAFDGQREGLTRDDVLDNITLTWLTNTAISSARLYRENKLPFFAPMGVAIPIAVSAFPDELYQAPRSWVERAYPKLIHYNKPDKGGHFAAWEQPALLTAEMRIGFSTLR